MESAAFVRETNESGKREAAARESSASLAITALENIAGGYWNAGRVSPMTVREYARETLRVVKREAMP